jgi:hypothetical protein
MEIGFSLHTSDSPQKLENFRTMHPDLLSFYRMRFSFQRASARPCGFLLLVLLACFHAGCLTRPQLFEEAPQSPPVRHIRFVGTPEHPDLAEKARELGNSFYPQIDAVLGDGRERQPFDIVFRKDLARHYKLSVKRTTQNMPKMMNYYPSGVAAGGKVYLDTETFLKEPGALDCILLHEMAHLAQNYSWYRRVTIPYYWQEGIAEAMVFKLENVHVPRDRPCKCSAVLPHYISGYSCTAAFLLYLEENYDSQLIARLNRAIRQGCYSDGFFSKITGRTLDQLWSEFVQTSHVTPMARKINQIYDALGYRNGKPPRDVKARFKAYLAKQPNGDEMIRLLDLAAVGDHQITDIRALVTTSVYFAGVGRSIIEANNLQNQNRLPGMAKDDRGIIWEPASIFDIDFQEHDSPHEIRGRKKGDSATYHYQFVRTCDDCPWTLDKAWRTDEAGAVVEQYAVEHD